MVPGKRQKGGVWEQKVCAPKIDRPDFPIVNSVLSHDGPYGLGGGGGYHQRLSPSAVPNRGPPIRRGLRVNSGPLPPPHAHTRCGGRAPVGDVLQHERRRPPPRGLRRAERGGVLPAGPAWAGGARRPGGRRTPRRSRLGPAGGGPGDEGGRGVRGALGPGRGARAQGAARVAEVAGGARGKRRVAGLGLAAHGGASCTKRGSDVLEERERGGGGGLEPKRLCAKKKHKSILPTRKCGSRGGVEKEGFKIHEKRGTSPCQAQSLPPPLDFYTLTHTQCQKSVGLLKQ